MPVTRMGIAFHPADEAPWDLEILRKRKVLPDFFSIRGEFGVSRAFKEILEELEPGVHQFFPIKAQRIDGEPVAGEYFIFVTCVLLDTALIPEMSNVIQLGKVETFPNGLTYDSIYYTASGPGPDTFTLDRKVIGDHHAWCDERLPKIFFSDEFVARIEAAKLGGVDLMTHTTDIDR